MNLGIEYAVRSGEVRRNLTLPMSLFTTSCVNRDKVVLTMHARRDGRLCVKRWNLTNTRMGDVVPPCEQNVVDIIEMFTSPHTILPLHDLLEYVEESTDLGSNRNLYQPFTVHEQREYDRVVSEFLNSRPHRQCRTDWLWSAFREVFPFDVWASAYETTPDNILADHAPWLRRQWAVWRQTFLEVSPAGAMVAAELVFAEAYAALRKTETRPTPIVESKGWSGITPFGFFPFYRAARAARLRA